MGWSPRMEVAHKYNNLRWVVSLILQDSLNDISNSDIFPSLMKFCPQRPLWMPRDRTGPSLAVMRKVEKNPHMRAWLESERLFLSPQRWPDLVYGAFQWRLIPSPVEIGSIDMRHHYLSTRGTGLFEHCVLLAYCYGFRLSDLSSCLGISERMLEMHLFQAVAHLFTLPAFVVWATATDFQKSLIPRNIYAVVGSKRSFISNLRRSPFVLPKPTFQGWVDSPRILSHLIYLTKKKPRLATTCRDTHLTEAADVP